MRCDRGGVVIGEAGRRVFFSRAAGLGALLGGCGRRKERERAASGAVKLWIAGDLHLGTGGAERARAVAAAVSPGALGIVNLEGPISAIQFDVSDRTDSGALRLTNGVGAAAALVELGVQAAGIANNHAMDVGEEGAAATAKALREVGIAPVGGAAGFGVIEANGVRVAVTAHDLTEGPPAGLEAELRAARAVGDLLVSTFHGTGPPSYLPSAGLRDAVAVALAAGAQVVAGHGSHALARVELREGAVIAWGLGNLAFDCRCTDERDALVLEVTLGARGLWAASVVAIDAGIGGEPATLASDPGLTFDLLAALGGAQGRREGGRMWLLEGGG
jgi:hypothetical protein